LSCNIGHEITGQLARSPDYFNVFFHAKSGAPNENSIGHLNEEPWRTKDLEMPMDDDLLNGSFKYTIINMMRAASFGATSSLSELRSICVLCVSF
jgi:hypothetical protein